MLLCIDFLPFIKTARRLHLLCYDISIVIVHKNDKVLVDERVVHSLNSCLVPPPHLRLFSRPGLQQLRSTEHLFVELRLDHSRQCAAAEQ